eukprot:CAMPEP_0178921542 /NCGR_PEP_ID=MMETSP0786-20121207/15623_1 /TAXON_ID=186022 /ORGANISM="Thalassionema frauenfeldii, Strain CCMP 1798" /LENGTH=166 /DNA_ID=CAMNT_0020595741 /DNA_START=41 /DNA_END=541 /DNA_ORIENTATION=+
MLLVTILIALTFVTGFSPFSVRELHLIHSKEKSFGLSILFNTELDSDSESIDDDEAVEDFDFEAAFRKRIEEEGGVTRLEMKSATREVVDRANSIVEDAGKISSSVTNSLTPSTVDEVEDFTLQSVLLFFILLIAGGVLFSFTMNAPFSDQPFETTEDGRALMFGV